MRGRQEGGMRGRQEGGMQGRQEGAPSMEDVLEHVEKGGVKGGVHSVVGSGGCCVGKQKVTCRCRENRQQVQGE